MPPLEVRSDIIDVAKRKNFVYFATLESGGQTISDG